MRFWKKLNNANLFYEIVYPWRRNRNDKRKIKRIMKKK